MGRATAELLRSRGQSVVTVDLHDADIAGDLGTAEGRASVVDAAPSGLTGVVTCAGLAGLTGRPPAPVISVNYFGTVDLLLGLRPKLTGGASVVVVSSNSATVYPGWDSQVVDACLAGDEPLACKASETRDSTAAYAASKAALARWTRRSAPAWAKEGIRLNAVMPGLVATPMSEAIAQDEQYGPLVDALEVPVGRSGRPEEIAALVAFLLGDDAGFFCGSVVLCDGGTEALLRPDAWPAVWQ
jgi:NAD(P)-dependent dehydrogenase (short-subunit alcohol dehydrogenase family)